MDTFAPATGWSRKGWAERFRCSEVFIQPNVSHISLVFLCQCGLVAFISDGQFSCARSAVNVTDTHILKCASSSRSRAQREMNLSLLHWNEGSVPEHHEALKALRHHHGPADWANGMANGVYRCMPERYPLRNMSSQRLFQLSLPFWSRFELLFSAVTSF